ncbi:cytochrome P450 4c3-like isoform X4 [Haemaphysalis longicornis]
MIGSTWNHSFGLLMLSKTMGTALFVAQALTIFLVTACLVAAAFLSVLKFIQLRKLRDIKNVPMRWEPIPYMNLWSLLRSCSGVRSSMGLSASLFNAVVGFHVLFKKHGIHMFFMGTTLSVSLQKAEYIEEVLSSNTLLAKGPEYGMLHSWLGSGLLTSTGKKWRTRRRLFTPAFHFRILEDFIPTINFQSQILAKKLGTLTREGKLFDIVPLVTLCTLDIICETIMGTSIRAQYDVGSPYVKAVNRLGELFIQRMMNPLSESEFFFKQTAMGKEYNTCLNTLHSFTRKVIAERKQSLQGEGYAEPAHDNGPEKQTAFKQKRPFLDLLINEHLKNPKSITEEDIREEVDTFMFEGHDTTAVGISWALFLIGHQPREQQKIHDELDAIFRNDTERHVTPEDLKEMRKRSEYIHQSPSSQELVKSRFESGAILFQRARW